MRITEIEIKNFKAFYGTYRIDLRKSGKNLARIVPVVKKELCDAIKAVKALEAKLAAN